MEDRKATLLRAAYDLLKAADDSVWVEDVLCLTAFYDDTECDGYCLMEDIAAELDIYNDR